MLVTDSRGVCAGGSCTDDTVDCSTFEGDSRGLVWLDEDDVLHRVVKCLSTVGTARAIYGRNPLCPTCESLLQAESDSLVGVPSDMLVEAVAAANKRLFASP
jgi:hypothetical protein